MIEFEVDMAYLLEEGGLDRVALRDENGELPPMTFEPSRGTCAYERVANVVENGLSLNCPGDVCSACGRAQIGMTIPKYCPNCGRKVVG